MDRLPPPDLSPARELRTLVGLRPYRPSGFVVRAEPLSRGRTLAHNYGHGGCGVTLCWGTAQLAVEAGLAACDERDWAVLGAGVVGLATALTLQRAGRRVTIYAETSPPETTSDIAAAIWGPTTLFEESRVGDAFLEQFVRAARLSHEVFARTAQIARSGVRPLRKWLLGREEPKMAARIGADLYRGLTSDPDAAALFGAGGATRHEAFMIDPERYLPGLIAGFEAAGGRIVRRWFESVDEVAALPERAVVNCTGLGARALFGDEELIPVRGQVTLFKGQPGIDYCYAWERDDGILYFYPREDTLLLGGTMGYGDWRTQVDESQRAWMLAEHGKIAARLAGGATPSSA
jgi:glycine/D-amino acid oxidase-like deaminating enzyme